MQESRISQLLEEIINEIESEEKKNRALYDSAIDIEDDELSLKTQTESFKILRQMRGLKVAVDVFKSELKNSGIIEYTPSQPKPTVATAPEPVARITPKITPEPTVTFEPTVVPEPFVKPAPTVFEPAVKPAPASVPEPAVKVAPTVAPTAVLEPAVKPASTAVFEPAAKPAPTAVLEPAVKAIPEIIPETVPEVVPQATFDFEPSFEAVSAPSEPQAGFLHATVEDSEGFEDYEEDDDYSDEDSGYINQDQDLTQSDSFQAFQHGGVSQPSPIRPSATSAVLEEGGISAVISDLSKTMEEINTSQYTQPEEDAFTAHSATENADFGYAVPEYRPQTWGSRADDVADMPFVEEFSEEKEFDGGVFEQETESPSDDSVSLDSVSFEDTASAEISESDGFDSVQAAGAFESVYESADFSETPTILEDDSIGIPVSFEGSGIPEQINVVDDFDMPEGQPSEDDIIDRIEFSYDSPFHGNSIGVDGKMGVPPIFEETDARLKNDESISMFEQVASAEPEFEEFEEFDAFGEPEGFDENGFAAEEPSFSVPEVGIYTNRHPAVIIIFGRKIAVSDWQDMLIKVCEVLILKSPYVVAQFDKYQDLNPVGKTYFSYKQEEVGSAGRKLSNGLWTELNRTPDDTVMICKKLLELCGYSRNELEIEFRD